MRSLQLLSRNKFSFTLLYTYNTVEAVANGVEDKLVDGLSFKLAPGASYVQDRRSVTFHPQGSNIYSPVQGTRMIKFLLSGDNWIDETNDHRPSLIRERLRPLGGPHILSNDFAYELADRFYKTSATTSEFRRCSQFYGLRARERE